ncbi:hypothetical protein ACI0X9_003393 [Cronobacter turicensis]
MDQGFFGLPIKAPGSLYWFNVSVSVLFIMSYQALMNGAFPMWFILLSLSVSFVTGMKYPFIDAEEKIRQPAWFITYCICLLLITNITDHLLHQRIECSGMLSIILAFVVGFYLGRYFVIGRFSIVPPAQTDEVKAYPVTGNKI